MRFVPGVCHIFECAIGFGPAHGLVTPGGLGRGWTGDMLSFHTSAARAESLELPGRIITGYYIIGRVITTIMEKAGLGLRSDWQRIRQICCDISSPLWIGDDCVPLEVCIQWTRNGFCIHFEVLAEGNKVLRKGKIELWPKLESENSMQPHHAVEKETDSEKWFREARLAVSRGKIPKL